MKNFCLDAICSLEGSKLVHIVAYIQLYTAKFQHVNTDNTGMQSNAKLKSGHVRMHSFCNQILSIMMNFVPYKLLHPISSMHMHATNIVCFCNYICVQ